MLTLIKRTFCGAAFMLTATSALALGPCDQVVVDTVGQLNNISGIEAAAAELSELTGADIRVRIESDHGSFRTLDGHVENIADTTCANEWSNDVASGDRYSNLIIYWVTMNRQVGIYYGDSWASELDRTWRGVIDSKMKPSLRDGNFDRAFIRGIEETQLVIERARTPSAPVTIISEPRAPREPVDLKPLVYVAGGLLAAVLLLLVLKSVLAYAGRMRKAKQTARNVWATTYGMFTRLNDMSDRIDAKIGEKADVSWIDPQTLTQWRRRYEQVSDEASAVNDVFRMTESDHFREVGTAEEFESKVEGLHENKRQLTLQAQALLDLEAEINAERDLYASFAADKSELIVATTEVQASLTDLETKGFIVTPLSNELDKAKAEIAKAQSHFDDKEYDEASKTLTEAVKQIASVQNAANTLPERKAMLLAKRQELSGLYEASGTSVQQAHEDYDSMYVRFAKVCLESVVGNGSEAEIRLKAVPEVLEEARLLLESQKWDEAESTLDGLTVSLVEISSLLEAVSALRGRLEAEEVAALDEIEEADRSIKVGRAHLRANPEDADVNRHRSNLSNAAVRLKQARELMQAKKPNVTAALRAAAAADQIADQAYEQAVEEQQQAERKRRMEKRLKSEALSAFSTAERYHRNHRGDVRSGARSKLSEAERLLRDMQRTSDIDEVIRLARAASQRSETALKQARRDHSSAESSRAAARRRRRSSSSSSFGGSSSSFGGGSSGFGGGGGFGGGSSGW